MRRNPNYDPRLGAPADLASIDLLLLDVDGVLTSGALQFDDEGAQSKVFHSRDGHGMRLLMEYGIDIAILTGRESGVVRHRSAELGIQHVLQGRRDKGAAFDELIADWGGDPARIAMVGDDLVDIPVMRRAGLAISVADGAAEVVAACHYVTEQRGGRGAVREIAEALLQARGYWNRVLDDAWSS